MRKPPDESVVTRFNENRRGTAIRDRHRKIIARDGLPCGICGNEIDYKLPYLDPGSYVVDHITPIARGGLDVLENKQPAHRKCNRTKGDKLPGEDRQPEPRRVYFVTHRTW